MAFLRVSKYLKTGCSWLSRKWLRLTIQVRGEKIMALRTLYGYYLPNGYVIGLPEYKFPEDCNPGAPGYFTLLHEYVHYLQDMTTLTGMRRAAAMLGIAQHISIILAKSDEPTLPYNAPGNVSSDPVKKTEIAEAQQYVRQMADCLRKMDGLDKHDAQGACELLDVQPYELVIQQGPNTERLKGIEVSFRESGAPTDKVAFGLIALQEGMAALAEKINGSDIRGLAWWPYHVSSSVAAHCCPGISDTAVLIASDVALNHSDAAWCFVELCTLLRTKNAGQGTMAQISQICWSYVNNDFPVQDEINRVVGFLRDIEWGVQMRENQKCDYPHKPFEWATDLMLAAAERRRQNPSFFMAAILPNANFKPEDLKEYGAPLIIDSRYLPASNLESEDPITHAMFHSGMRALVLSAMTESTVPCELTYCCPLVTRECWTKPWVKALQERTCPTGLAGVLLAMNQKISRHYS
ncbi:MAG: hypothetical protein K1X53_03935 [Candidatus Sumerlaeaceae bacterium]|nr:hypothetical protein [Candidatus Sumerlaeaceae bacterium]